MNDASKGFILRCRENWRQRRLVFKTVYCEWQGATYTRKIMARARIIQFFFFQEPSVENNLRIATSWIKNEKKPKIERFCGAGIEKLTLI